MITPYGESYWSLNRYDKVLEFKAMTKVTFITPWSLLGVTSMPFAANMSVADWASMGKS